MLLTLHSICSTWIFLTNSIYQSDSKGTVFLLTANSFYKLFCSKCKLFMDIFSLRFLEGWIFAQTIAKVVRDSCIETCREFFVWKLKRKFRENWLWICSWYACNVDFSAQLLRRMKNIVWSKGSISSIFIWSNAIGGKIRGNVRVIGNVNFEVLKKNRRKKWDYARQDLA